MDHSFILHPGAIVSVSKAMKQAMHPPSAPEEIMLFFRVRYIDEGVTAEFVTPGLSEIKNPTSGHLGFYIMHSMMTDPIFISKEFQAGLWTRHGEVRREHLRCHYVNAVVDVCNEMAEWKGHELGGVDGKNLKE
jgi:hypothetical protein